MRFLATLVDLSVCQELFYSWLRQLKINGIVNTLDNPVQQQKRAKKEISVEDTYL